MIEQIVLETEGFRFSFDIDYAWTDQTQMGMIVTFQLLPSLPEFIVHSARTSISIVDLHRLSTYFEQHMKKLREANGDVVSDTFVNWELGFQIQASEGNTEPPMDEIFSICCQANVGKGKDGHDVFVGGESTITFAQTQAFLRNIQMFLDKIPTLPARLSFGQPDNE